MDVFFLEIMILPQKLQKIYEIFTATYANDTNDTSRRKETKFGKNVEKLIWI